MLHPLLALLLSCGPDEPVPVEVQDLDVQSQAGICVSLQFGTSWLAGSGETYVWGPESQAARFRMQPADLGVYLLYDQDGRYLVAEEGPLTRQEALESDMTRIEDLVLDDTYISGGEWELQASSKGGAFYQLRSHRNGLLLGSVGLVPERDALALLLRPAEGCAEHPELSLDAEGAPTRTTFEDGTLYGIADAHSHIFSNFGFGGGESSMAAPTIAWASPTPCLTARPTTERPGERTSSATPTTPPATTATPSSTPSPSSSLESWPRTITSPPAGRSSATGPTRANGPPTRYSTTAGWSGPGSRVCASWCSMPPATPSSATWGSVRGCSPAATTAKT